MNPLLSQMMSADQLKILLGVFVWGISIGVVWHRLIGKLNGLGKRVGAVERADEKVAGRVEKSLDHVTEQMQKLELEITREFSDIKTLIYDRDTARQVQIAKVEGRLEQLNGRE